VLAFIKADHNPLAVNRPCDRDLKDRAGYGGERLKLERTAERYSASGQRAVSEMVQEAQLGGLSAEGTIRLLLLGNVAESFVLRLLWVLVSRNHSGPPSHHVNKDQQWSSPM
jgi:hypothetical protein